MTPPGRESAEPAGPAPRTLEPSTEHARRFARELTGAGQRISRRALRSRGVRGSNQALSALALILRAELAIDTTGRRMPVWAGNHAARSALWITAEHLTLRSLA